jgi:hypothetical protein
VVFLISTCLVAGLRDVSPVPSSHVLFLSILQGIFALKKKEKQSVDEHFFKNKNKMLSIYNHCFHISWNFYFILFEKTHTF